MCNVAQFFRKLTQSIKKFSSLTNIEIPFSLSNRCHLESCVTRESKQADGQGWKTSTNCPSDLTAKKGPRLPKVSAEKGEQSGKETPGMASATQDSGQKCPLLNHPLWLVVNATSRSSASQQAYTEILCKRISWIVAQTIVKQLVSVVNTSI